MSRAPVRTGASRERAAASVVGLPGQTGRLGLARGFLAAEADGSTGPARTDSHTGMFRSTRGEPASGRNRPPEHRQKPAGGGPTKAGHVFQSVCVGVWVRTWGPGRSLRSEDPTSGGLEAAV